MRPPVSRALLPLAGLLLFACSDNVPLEEARSAAVVEAGGATLDGATLESWLLAAPAEPAMVTATVLVSAFIDAALVGEALRNGETLEDSATVASAVIPDAIRGTILDHFATRANDMPEPTDAEADSLARLGGTRVFQHILFPIDWATADSTEVQARAAEMRALAGRIQAGEDFGAMAREFSGDSTTRATGGFLPAITRSDLPDERFASAAWQLQPGETSGIVPSPAGIHLLRRTPLAEAGTHFKRWLAPRLARRADSVWVDSLSRARNLDIPQAGAERLRALAHEPHVPADDAPYATWEGGALTPAQVQRWVTMLPPVEKAGLTNAPDSAATLFLREVAQREMVYHVVTGGAELSPRGWEALAPQFRSAVATVREQMRPHLESTTDPSGSAAAYVVAVTTGGVPYRPLPGGLAGALRSRSEVSINRPAIEALIAATRPVWLERRAADSMAPGTSPAAGAPVGDTVTP